MQYDFYRISHNDIGNETYFKTKAAAEAWLKEGGYILADRKIWDHVYTDDGGKSHTFLCGEIFQETFDSYVPTWWDKLLQMFWYAK
jgi:hypothetical protein